MLAPFSYRPGDANISAALLSERDSQVWYAECDRQRHAFKKKEKSGITNWMSGAYKSQGKAMSSDAEQQSSRAAEQQSSRQQSRAADSSRAAFADSRAAESRAAELRSSRAGVSTAKQSGRQQSSRAAEQS